MRLTLSNFGVWTNKTFEFPDTGLTLISGPSGRGKTTIFRAINYALTGEGTKLPTLGEVKCAVTFEYQGIVMTRTNRPSRLTLKVDGTTLENDEAQGYIYSRIGKHFNAAGYIQQKGENSFLGMTPAEKLRFLERVAFGEIHMEEVKEKAREMVREKERVFDLAQERLKVYQSTPLSDPGECEYTLSKVEEEKNTEKKRLNDLQTSLPKLREEYKQVSKLEDRKQYLTTAISKEVLREVPNLLPEDNEDVELKQWEAVEAYQREQDIAKKNQITYIDPQEKEIESLTREIEQLSLSSFTRGDELVELTEALREYNIQTNIKQKQAAFSQERFNELSIIIPEKERKYHSMLLGKDVKTCPGCKTKLRFGKADLELYTGDIDYSQESEQKLKKEIVTLKAELTKLEIAKAALVGLPEIIEEIELDVQEVTSEIKSINEEKVKYEKQIKDRDEKQRKVQTIKASLTKLIDGVRKVKDTVEPIRPKKSKAELNNRKIAIRDRKVEIQHITKENEKTTQKINEMTKELRSIVLPQNSSEINVLISQAESQIAQIYIHLEVLEKRKQDCLTHQRKLDEYIKWKENVSRSTETYREAEAKYTLAKKFASHLYTAEMLALNGLIEEINSHLAVYLEVFFPDNPITLDLRLFKSNEKTKTIRNQVNISIGYRGVTTDMTTLSGGEKDRINLAFTLALAEIFGVPLLMLDETLSSLDREMTESVLEHIQKDSRAILVVAHQVSTGLFDHVFPV